MAEEIDVRGLSCPGPVLRIRERMTACPTGRFYVVVDDETTRENIMRLGEREGWEVSEQPEKSGYRLMLEKR